MLDKINVQPGSGWFIIIMSAITVIVGGFLGGLFTLLNTKYKFNLEEKKYAKLSLKDKIKVSFALKKYLREIRIELKADRASLCLYHNGETFISGMKIDRFSMHQEDVAPGVELIHGYFQRLNVANYPHTTYDLLFDKVVICEDITICQDDAIRIYCDKIGVKSFFHLLLETDKEKPLGFISVSFHETNSIGRDQILFAQTYLHKFVRLITDNYSDADIKMEAIDHV